MKHIPTKNSLYAISSVADVSLDSYVPIDEWRTTRLELMLRFKKEFNVYYKEVEEYLKENENFDVEKDIGFIDEYPLSIGYIEPNVNDTPPYWQYLISYGGPGSEIRFFVGDKSSTEPYKVEFWFSDWFNSTRQDVTNETIIEHVWEQAMLPLVSSSEGIAYGETQENTELVRVTQETDPLLALAGTLDLDVTDIKKRLKNAVRPKTRVVKGPYEDHPGSAHRIAGYVGM